MSENEVSITVYIDDHHILSADDNNAILLGHTDDDDEDDDRCVLLVTREVYLAATSAWLDAKAEMARTYNGEFCGVGPIYFNKAKLHNEVEHRLPALDAVKGEVVVDAYTATEFEVDMEHG
jgi:hypothetical protein